MSTYHLTQKSGNAKTGPIPVSTTSDDTCPPSCPLGAACYAESGYHLRMHWRKVSRGTRGDALPAFLEKVRALPTGQLWRHNQAGDLPGRGEHIAKRDTLALADAAAHTRGFTYTHKRPNARNRAVVDAARDKGFGINWSADDLQEADRFAPFGATVVIVPTDAPKALQTPEGRPVVVCPAQTVDGMTCADCGLCARMDRTPIVGFRAHGTAAKAAERIAKGTA